MCCSAMALRVLLLLGALASHHGFNLDVEEPVVFREDGAGFGQTVAQFGRSRVVVGAPLEPATVNHTGQLYACEVATGLCQRVFLRARLPAANMSLGLSLAASADRSSLLACGPTLRRACGENVHVEGACLLLGARLQLLRSVPAARPECPTQEMDIAFLIDGSGSIEPSDFKRMKDFVKAVMGQFASTNAQFSLMQYSNLLDIHFSFSDFRASPSPQRLVDPIVQLKGLTFTATGILTVVKELFHSKNGARRGARKILVVITDGQKYKDPLEYSDVIPQAEHAGILRYAIGVGVAFQEPIAKQELDTIGSKPVQDHVFKVDNFEALGSIQKQLQEKIFAVEGTQSGTSSSFQYEMSQEGFSSVLTTDGPVLGAVGSFGWSGGAFTYPPNNSPTFINMSQENVDMRDSYLGYAIELALRKGVKSLVLGAPRHLHTGKVVLFTQIGSYFGASLCSVDVDRDGSSDLVLIGAPHYYEPTRGGQVSVCSLPRGRARWRCEAVLRGEQGHPWGRFGAALTTLGDVNGDKLTDVAIGAPGEQENQGAVYLFHGTSELGVSPAHSQRIVGSQFSPRLQHFGQSLSGGQDLTLDRLVDLAVGAQGHVLLLRTRPVLRVWVDIHPPAEIPRSVYECRELSSSVQQLGYAHVCLHIDQSPKIQLDDLQSSVTFDLTLDLGRLNPRAIFKDTNTQSLTLVRVLGLGRHCENVMLLLQACVEDSVTPITLSLNFSLEGKPIPSFGNLQPMLAVDALRYYSASIPFEKNCGEDRICQDDLGVSFGFSGLKTLVVGSSLELDMEVKVWNEGEDSYGTSVTFSYPPGLSYRRVARIQSKPQFRSLNLNCDSAPAQGQESRSTRCSLQHLIFRQGAQITFVVTFDVSPKATLGDRLLLRANVSSENNAPRSSKTTFQQELPVKYAAYAVISRHEASTKYLNFSASEEKGSHVAQHRFQVNNLGQRDLPVSIHFLVPVELNQVAVWTGLKFLHPQNPSLQCPSERIAPTEATFLTRIQRDPVLDCAIADCLRFRCDLPALGIQEELDFILMGNLSFSWLSQTLQKKVAVVSVAEIMLDTAVYSQLLGQEASLRAQTQTVLEEYEVRDPVPLIVGSSVGGLLLLALITALLHKLGFFKRQYKELLDDKLRDTATVGREAPDSPLSS